MKATALSLSAFHFLLAVPVLVGTPPWAAAGPPEEIRVTFLGDRGVVFRDDPPWSLDDYIGGAGDVDGDGLADFLLASSKNDESGYDQRVILIHGRRDFPREPAMEDVLARSTILRHAPSGAFFDHIWGMGPAGDVDRDGFADFLLLRPESPPVDLDPQTTRGIVYLVHGAASLAHEISLDEPGDGVRVARLSSSRPVRTTLANSSAFGEVSGDAADDIILGACFAESEDPMLDVFGRVYVLLGPADLSGVVDVEEAGSRIPGWVLLGDRQGEFLGHAVEVPGDVDGDGIGDLLLGASNIYGALPGAAYLVRGGPSAPPSSISEAVAVARAVRFVGREQWSSTGDALASPGDLNRDGLADLAIGAPSGAGEVYIVYGRSDFPQEVPLEGIASGGRGVILRGEGRDAWAGSSLSAIRYGADEDLDIVIGSPGCWGRGVAGVGRAYVVQGADLAPGVQHLIGIRSGWVAGTIIANEDEEWVTGDRDWTFGTGERFASSVASPGDVDGDGADDILFSLPARSRDDVRPAVYLIRGRGAALDALALDRVEPSRIPLEGEVEVTVLGTGFDSTASATIGGLDAPVMRVETSARLVVLAPPAESLGPADLVVRRGAEAATLEAAVQHVAPVHPSIDVRTLAADSGGFIVRPAREPFAMLDFDGDGLGEIVAGCQTGGLHVPGGLFIVWGRSPPPVEVQLPGCDAALEGLGLSYVDCGEAVEHLELATGDANGDGRPDLAVSSPIEVTVLLGGARLPERTSLEELVGGGRAARVIHGLDTTAAVAGGADLDGDGLGDLAVRIKMDSIGRKAEVFIVPGARTWPAERFLYDFPCWRSLAEEDGLGEGLALVSDLNGDGRGEIVLGAPMQDDESRVYIAYGRSFFLDEYLEDIVDSGSATRLDAYKPRDYLGRAACALGDFNGDAIGDFAVSAEMGGPAFAGEATVVLGGRHLDPTPGGRSISLRDLGSKGLRITGTCGYDYMNIVAPAGDFNGDGLADLAIGGGGLFSASRVCVVFGGPSRSVRLDDLGSDGLQVLGFPFVSRIIGGDVNGDGLGDIGVSGITTTAGWDVLHVILGRRPRPSEEPTFLRGDSNADGRAEISDAVHLLVHLFLGGPAPPCPDAADTNDDGKLGMTDSIYLLNHLFLGGGPPPPPYPWRGHDLTADVLGCMDAP